MPKKAKINRRRVSFSACARPKRKNATAVRTTKQANERMLNLLLQEGLLERLAILHTGTEPRAREFLNTLMQKASQSVPRDILMVNVTTVIGTHVGPNGLGFAAIHK